MTTEIDAIERIILKKDPKIPMVVIREHLLRYILALESVTDKDVLDLGFGSGFGMHLMSYFAKSVSGYDYSEEALNEAKKFQYHCDCCLEIRNLEEDKSLANSKHDKFGVVTFFETIEHLSNPHIVLKNIKECLALNGIVYISTPNDLTHTDKNKWHKVHFDFYSLFNLIKETFNDPKVEFWGQDQWGLTKDYTKPYIVAKINL